MIFYALSQIIGGVIYTIVGALYLFIKTICWLIRKATK